MIFPPFPDTVTITHGKYILFLLVCLIASCFDPFLLCRMRNIYYLLKKKREEKV